MASDPYTWTRIAPAGAPLAEEGQVLEVALPSRRICLARWEGRLYAFAHKCPHAGGFFSEGRLDARGNVICPVHRYAYNIRNGYNSSGEGYHLVTYPVEQREDGVYVGFRRSGFLNIFKG
ncbi:Rieske (2Fe-2S) protein [Compostibacter hankyongensis]|uniref:Rieske domain-containing protein n=1 Tax=Compostibacter hankyongensis TaxID=1007089 RepID=A0ABP8FCW9_9BACT